MKILLIIPPAVMLISVITFFILRKVLQEQKYAWIPLVFTLIFTAGAILFFPYSKAVQCLLDEQISKYNLPVEYASVTSGLFSTVISKVEIFTPKGNVTLDNITIKYSPLSLAGKKIRIDVYSQVFGRLNIQAAKSKITASGEFNTDSLGKFAQVGFSGDKIILECGFDINSMEGTYFIKNGNMLFNGVPLKNISAQGIIKNTTITLDSFKTGGDISASATGQLKINTGQLYKSTVNISGEVIMFNMRSKLSISGQVANPNFSLK